MMKTTSKKLTIFEGPDCSGKTTLAEKYAKDTGARYVHFNNLPHVTNNLARMYVEAMLPALLGYQDVVFDRCWLSEVPYGKAFRQGQDRLGEASRRMLERLALRCGAVVVRCRPSWKQVRETFMQRQGEEYLQSVAQLEAVYHNYDNPTNHTGLPEVVHDYVHDLPLNYLALDLLRPPRHPLSLVSAGHWRAPVMLIGERFASLKDCDPFYQWPFASFNQQGCSQWLTEQLILHRIKEQDLLWLNADQDLSVLYELQPQRIIALGKAAYQQLYELKIPTVVVPHPQHQKRFNHDQPYELFNYIR